MAQKQQLVVRPAIYYNFFVDNVLGVCRCEE